MFLVDNLICKFIETMIKLGFCVDYLRTIMFYNKITSVCVTENPYILINSQCFTSKSTYTVSIVLNFIFQQQLTLYCVCFTSISQMWDCRQVKPVLKTASL